MTRLEHDIVQRFADSAPTHTSQVVPDNIDYDGKDFKTQAEAQAYFEPQGGSPTNNVDRLDADHHGGRLRELSVKQGWPPWTTRCWTKTASDSPCSSPPWRTGWFERARFEWHPGSDPARWDVMLGRVGAELLVSRPIDQREKP